MSNASHLQLAQEYPPPGEEADIKRVIEIILEKYKLENKPGVAGRDAHPKAHGTVKGEFIVHDNLPEKCRHGVFKEARTFPAFIRFSAAFFRPQPDKTRDAHGMAIKLMGVEGEKLLEEEKHEQTQDFLMANIQGFFVRNVKQYIALSEALLKKDSFVPFFFPSWNPFKWRPYQFWRGMLALWTRVYNPLQIQYWSQAPYRLGPHAIKFSARSRMPKTDTKPVSDHEHFLTEAMAQQLKREDVSFDFMVQFQTDPVKMPIEDPVVLWDEDESPYITVATVHIPQQEFTSPQKMEYAEHISFAPWHALPEHRPLGGLNRARRVAYETISKLRHQMNTAPRREPTGFEEFESS
jgi:hypothetical protein